GPFAPNAKHRNQIITPAPSTAQCVDDVVEVQPSVPMSWMQRLRRGFAIGISTCACCGGKVRVIAAITQPALITPHPRSSGQAR
ncbi:MAG: cysteine synthase, partial [Gammaproteobacteria bacterium]